MLNKIFRDLFDDLTWAQSVGPTDEFFTELCERYGLKNAAYLGINLPAKNHREYFVHNTYSKEWGYRYETNKYVIIDPIIKRGFGSLMPIDWSEVEKLSPEQAKFFGEAQEFKIGQRGLTFPLHGLHNETAIFSLTADMSAKTWLEFKRAHLRDMRILGDLYHQKIISRVVGKRASSEVRLTKREIECLKWSAEGKTHLDVADILGISPRTVRFFLEGAKRKLDALNTTHAVASAVLQGVI